MIYQQNYVKNTYISTRKYGGAVHYEEMTVYKNKSGQIRIIELTSGADDLEYLKSRYFFDSNGLITADKTIHVNDNKLNNHLLRIFRNGSLFFSSASLTDKIDYQVYQSAIELLDDKKELLQKFKKSEKVYFKVPENGDTIKISQNHVFLLSEPAFNAKRITSMHALDQAFITDGFHRDSHYEDYYYNPLFWYQVRFYHVLSGGNTVGWVFSGFIEPVEVSE